MKLILTMLAVFLGLADANSSPKAALKAASKVSLKAAPKADLKKKGLQDNCKKARTLKIYLVFAGPFIEPNGTIVDIPDTTIGLRLPYAGSVFDRPGGKAVGFDSELCTRLNDSPNWYCEGTLQNLYGCTGNLNFAGPFTDESLTGDYTITAGTRDFDGAKGYIMDKIDSVTGATNRTIYLHF